jgi:hypothetical protein
METRLDEGNYIRGKHGRVHFRIAAYVRRMCSTDDGQVVDSQNGREAVRTLSGTRKMPGPSSLIAFTDCEDMEQRRVSVPQATISILEQI